MELRHLRMFVAVAEEGSVRGGARRLLVGQPHVSAGIQRLERELKAQLIVRSPTGISLTPAGEALAESAREILVRLDRAVQEVRDTAAEESTIRIGLMAGPLAAAELTAPIIGAFRDAYPRANIAIRDLTFDRQVEALVSGEIDVALVRPPIADDRLALTTLFTEPTALCVNPRHRLAGRTEVDVEDVLEERMVDIAGLAPELMRFWHLDDLRRGPARTDPTNAVTMSELQVALLQKDAVLPVAYSCWRMVMSHGTLRTVALRGAPVSQVAVATLLSESRPVVSAFVQSAQSVAGEMCELVEGAVAAT